LRIWFCFQAYKNLYSPKKVGKNEKNLNKKVSVAEKKIGSEIGPWFRSHTMEGALIYFHLMIFPIKLSGYLLVSYTKNKKV
jgi:hypothetical protein